MAALFHNVRSTYNVGALLRTADGAGAAKIYLTGITPTPIDRFGRTDKSISKTALGAETTVPWEYANNPNTVIKKLRAEGWAIVGVEQDARSVDYRAFKTKKPILFVFGNEVRGLSPTLRRQCDALVEIPMRGEKESLNVSVAAGIILFNFSN
ncbi:MAG TPA: TrmH family RNA methyltransferase [Candidatus Paceibacterota bacterium]|nr:TrmH family RNA methyltransferase [Candidatus Paceibacterota bacterium]